MILPAEPGSHPLMLSIALLIHLWMGVGIQALDWLWAAPELKAGTQPWLPKHLCWRQFSCCTGRQVQSDTLHVCVTLGRQSCGGCASVATIAPPTSILQAGLGFRVLL